MLNNFFKPYKDSPFAHAFEILEMVSLLLIILWVQTGVTSGTSEYDIVDFTFKLGMLAFVFKMADFVIWFVSPNKSLTSPLQTLSFGTGWRLLWGAVIGVISFGFLSGGTNLSFFSTFLQFNTVYMFWFLVFIGPRIEEMFSNVLHPFTTRLLMLIRPNMTWFMAGTIALLFIVAPLFAGFHYFTYYSKSGANMSTLIFMMAVAYVSRCIFTLGNYILKTDEYGKFAHMTHNFIGYWLTVGNPAKILPEYQKVLLFLFFIGFGLYYSSYLVVRLHKYKRIDQALKPDTVFDDI